MRIFNAILVFLLICLVGTLVSQDKSYTNNMDNEKREDIIKLLKLSGTSDFAYIIIDDVVANYKQFISNTPENYWEDIIAKTDILPFNEAVIPIYDKRFTKEEIKELVRFFESVVGNKWALALKEMNEEVMLVANQFGQDIYKSINQKLIDDGYINQPEIEQSKPNNN